MKKSHKKLLAVVLSLVLAMACALSSTSAALAATEPGLFPKNMDPKTKLTPVEEEYFNEVSLGTKVNSGERVPMDIYLISKKGRLIYQAPVNTSDKEGEYREQTFLSPENDYLVVLHIGKKRLKKINGLYVAVTDSLMSLEDGMIYIAGTYYGKRKYFAMASYYSNIAAGKEMEVTITNTKKVKTIGSIYNTINSNGDYCVVISTKTNAKSTPHIDIDYNGPFHLTFVGIVNRH